MSSSFGKIFKISTWGESHGHSIGVVIDGCPALVEINESIIQKELDRRRPGQSRIVTQRKEKDKCKILSGVFEGKTTGTPIAIMVENSDQISKDYDNIKNLFRPSHADFTYQKKYGIRDYRGGGRASARNTIAHTASGAIAKEVLKKYIPNYQIYSYVLKIKDIKADIDYQNLNTSDIDSNIVRTADLKVAKKMEEEVRNAKSKGDSVGGVIECCIKNVPIGLGEPIFDKLEANLAKAMLGLPASKGFEIGSGFDGTTLYGSEHNDEFYNKNGEITTKTNYSGGIQGGISNGQDIIFRVAFKPTATILMNQKTIDKKGNNVDIKVKGRHDPCVLPRAVPIVEAMTNIVISDHLLLNMAGK